MTFERARCQNHPDEPRLGYIHASIDAEERIKRREQQWKCGRCGLWVWGEFMVDMTGAVSEGWAKKEEQRAAK